MSAGSLCSDAKRIKLDLLEVTDPIVSTFPSNSNFDDLLNSPSDTGENISIISAFDHDSSSILSGSFYESSCEVLSSEVVTKGILKTPDVIRKTVNRNKKRIKFHEIEIFYFNRQQSFCSVPSLGGSALGMEMHHFSSEKITFDMAIGMCRKRSDSNSFVNANEYSRDEILQPIVAKNRRILLKNSGTSRIETVDKEVCDLIRSSRERCGCQCVAGQCLPETCSCAQNGIQCQVDRGNFPCCCGPNPCANPLGRVEFNPIRVRTHFIHTMMRLQMQDQYQSDEPKEFSKSLECNNDGNGDIDSKFSREFDINMCNSTDQGSCRDCQNDKYLQVLMNEWTHQLQKLHTSKHYGSSVSIPYNSWTYIPETFYSSAYCDKEISMFPILPYSHYTVSNLPSLNFGIHQVNYPSNSVELEYRPSTLSYNTDFVEEIFNPKPDIVSLSVIDEANEPIKNIMQQPQNSSTLTTNSIIESVTVNDLITSSGSAIFTAEKPPIYTRYPYEKSSSYLCKYSTHFSSRHSDLKEPNYATAAYVNTAPYSPNKPHSEPTPITPLCEEYPSYLWNDDTIDDKVTHASNGQLYTVLQPVSQSGIVSTFYQNSQASDSCKMCKYKSPFNRQRPNHLCISDQGAATAVTPFGGHQVPVECTDKSEVCV